MSFASYVKGREIVYITRLFGVFPVVEQEQMRRLFSHMNDTAYGRLLTRLDTEGQIYWAKDGVHLAGSRLTMRNSNVEDSVLSFWAFVASKDSIRDFCAGEPPTIVTIASKEKISDIIPVRSGNAEEINKHMDEIPAETQRFLVTRDERLLMDVWRREKNDYALLVDSCGNLESYRL